MYIWKTLKITLRATSLEQKINVQLINTVIREKTNPNSAVKLSISILLRRCTTLKNG